MKRTEVILIIIVILSVILNMLNVTGDILFTALSTFVLSSFYFYLGAFLFNGIPLKGIFKKASYTGISTPRILGAVYLGFTFAMLLLGLLFKFNYWPGGHIMLLLGINSLILSSIVMFIKLIISKDSFYRKHLVKSVIMLVVAIGYYFLPFGVIEGIKYRNNHEMLALVDELKADINNEGLWKKFHYLNNKDMVK